MNKNKLDRRQIRTKKLIRQALLELTGEKGLAHITVKDVAERAEINRGTFYLHYTDVDDLTDKLKSEIFEGATLVAFQMQTVDFKDIKSYAERNEPFPAIVKLLDYFLTQADFLQAMLGPKGDPQLPIQLRELLQERMYKNLQKQLKPSSTSAFRWDYFLAYITSANLGILTHWMKNGNDLSTYDVALLMTNIMVKGPLDIVIQQNK